MEKLCKRCPQAPDCRLDYLQEECRHLRKEKSPDIRPNRAEIIAAMTLDEMATKLVDAILYDLCEDGVPSRESIRHWFENEPMEEEILFIDEEHG